MSQVCRIFSGLRYRPQDGLFELPSCVMIRDIRFNCHAPPSERRVACLSCRDSNSKRKTYFTF